MSFAAPRSASSSLHKRSSPPRGSAEVAAKFSSNIRGFEGRRPSPRNFLRRKLPKTPLVSPAKKRRKQSPVMRERTPQKIFNSGDDEKLKESLFSESRAKRSVSPAFSTAAPAAAAPRASNSDSLMSVGATTHSEEEFFRDSEAGEAAAARARSPAIIAVKRTATRSPPQPKQQQHQQHQLSLPRKPSSESVAASESDSVVTATSADFFKLKSYLRFKSPGHWEKSSNYSPQPFYSADEHNTLWIATHARLVEIVIVEQTLRERIERLELDQLHLLFKFRSNLVL